MLHDSGENVPGHRIRSLWWPTDVVTPKKKKGKEMNEIQHLFQNWIIVKQVQGDKIPNLFLYYWKLLYDLSLVLDGLI